MGSGSHVSAEADGGDSGGEGDVAVGGAGMAFYPLSCKGLDDALGFFNEGVLCLVVYVSGTGTFS